MHQVSKFDSDPAALAWARLRVLEAVEYWGQLAQVSEPVVCLTLLYASRLAVHELVDGSVDTLSRFDARWPGVLASSNGRPV